MTRKPERQAKGWQATPRAIRVGVLLAVFCVGTSASLWTLRPARAYPYSFDWLGIPYIADSHGQYAYRDLTFSWDYWRQGLPGGPVNTTSVYPVSSYINIVTQGRAYYGYGVTVQGDGPFPGNGLASYKEPTGWSATYSNTPFTVSVPTWVFPSGNVAIAFGMCQAASECAWLYVPPWGIPFYAATLNARITMLATSAYSYYSWFPAQAW